MYTKQDLINYRIDKAYVAFTDAELLFKNKSYQACANRLYYALYYIISAYLIFLGFEPKSHSGIKILFHKELIKTNILTKNTAFVFDRLYDLRNDADYLDFLKVEENDVKTYIPQTLEIINLVKSKLTVI